LEGRGEGRKKERKQLLWTKGRKEGREKGRKEWKKGRNGRKEGGKKSSYLLTKDQGSAPAQGRKGGREGGRKGGEERRMPRQVGRKIYITEETKKQRKEGRTNIQHARGREGEKRERKDGL
jgi:hypothetical protein